jgi:hypothetical protein
MSRKLYNLANAFQCSFRCVSALVLSSVVLVNPTRASNRTWVGGNNDWNTSSANWSPGDEPDEDDTALFDSNVSVDLANATEAIAELGMSNGADLDLNGNDLTVGGQVVLSGAGTNLIVPGPDSMLRAESITLVTSTRLVLRGGAIEVSESGSGTGYFSVFGGTLFGHGTISLTDGLSSNATLLQNYGEIVATSTAIDIGGSTAATLTINALAIPYAQLDLDGPFEDGVVTVARNDTLRVDANLADGFDGTINLSAGATLDFVQGWSLGGVLNVNTEGVTPGTAGSAATIAGNVFNYYDGVIEINPLSTLRIASSLNAGAGVIDIDGGTLILDGGAIIFEDVDITLRNEAVLRGKGQIIANVNPTGFDSGPESLLADNGTLRLDGDFNGLIIGTVDEDGVLEITHTWDTSSVNKVALNGGELRGATITNGGANGLGGHGLISALIVNSSFIAAQNGGTLVVATPTNENDWDGASGAGELRAESADLELRDNASTPFNGEVIVSAGRQVFANGFALLFQAPSTLTIQGSGRYRSTHDTAFGGAISIGAGTATIQVDGVAELSSSDQATLTGDLVLDNEITLLEPGAHLTGGGSLVNTSGRRLIVYDGVTAADLAVALINRGTLEIDQAVPAGHTAGQIQGVDFEQAATGVWQVDVGGVGVNSFDRFNLTGIAALDGDLELVLFDGFVPAVGQSFNILSASGGVTGAFDDVLQPAGMPFGLAFNVIYLPTIVQLQVVSAGFPGDFDADGDVDGRDFLVWQRNPSVGDLADWQVNYGAGSLSASTAVPEPSVIQLIFIAAVAFYTRRR